MAGRSLIGRRMAACLLGMVVGFILILIPGFLKDGPGPLLVMVSNAVEGLGIAHVALFFVAGLFFGSLLEYPYSLLSSVSVLGGLPIVAFIEMLKDPTSHNLWPFEFLSYAVLTLIPLAGMRLATWIKREFRSTPVT